MSIWTSIPPAGQPDILDNIPDRNSYTGNDDPGWWDITIDVATARTWHDKIRLSIDANTSTEVILTRTETQELIRRLLTALNTTEPSHTSPEAPTAPQTAPRHPDSTRYRIAETAIQTAEQWIADGEHE